MQHPLYCSSSTDRSCNATDWIKISKVIHSLSFRWNVEFCNRCYNLTWSRLTDVLYFFVFEYHMGVSEATLLFWTMEIHVLYEWWIQSYHSLAKYCIKILFIYFLQVIVRRVVSIPFFNGVLCFNRLQHSTIHCIFWIFVWKFWSLHVIF